MVYFLYFGKYAFIAKNVINETVDIAKHNSHTNLLYSKSTVHNINPYVKNKKVLCLPNF